MSALFKGGEVSDWKATYAKRGQYVALKEQKTMEGIKKGKRKNKEELLKNMKLVEFDKYLFNELRERIKNREDDEDDYMTLDELSIVMKWKLLRGKFRPRLQALIDSNKNELVIKCTKSAFKIVHNAIDEDTNNIDDVVQLKLSLKELDKLKGVGVATASLILSIYTNVVPFMADESLMGVSPGVKLKYDQKTYLKYVMKLVAKCECLWTSYVMCRYGEIEGDEDEDRDIKAKLVKKAKKKKETKQKNSKKKKNNKKRKADKDTTGQPPSKKRKV